MQRGTINCVLLHVNFSFIDSCRENHHTYSSTTGWYSANEINSKTPQQSIQTNFVFPDILYFLYFHGFLFVSFIIMKRRFTHLAL